MSDMSGQPTVACRAYYSSPCVATSVMSPGLRLSCHDSTATVDVVRQRSSLELWQCLSNDSFALFHTLPSSNSATPSTGRFTPTVYPVGRGRTSPSDGIARLLAPREVPVAGVRFWHVRSTTCCHPSLRKTPPQGLRRYAIQLRQLGDQFRGALLQGGAHGLSFRPAAGFPLP
jgi:hypothetical protein